jgi:hypothetical protein
MKKQQHGFFILLFLFSYFVKAANDQLQPSWMPKITCTKFWGDSKNGDYDFDKYSVRTRRGNIGYGKYFVKAQREKCFKEWTVLVYMAGDNDLSPYSLWDIAEIEKKIKGELNLGASTNDVDMVVELDTWDKKEGIRRLHLFQTNEKYQKKWDINFFKGENSGLIQSPIVDWFSEREFTPTVDIRFNNFLRWGIKRYPAKNYMVIIWGHGEGFIGPNTQNYLMKDDVVKEYKKRKPLFLKPEEIRIWSKNETSIPVKFTNGKPFGGVAFDYSDESYLDILTLKNILTNVKSDLFENKKNFDLLAFDACLMQSLEVAMELSSTVNFMVGSVQVQDYLGLPYRKILDKLQERPSSYTMAKELPDLVAESYDPKTGYQGKINPDAYNSYTVSSLALGQLNTSVREVLMKWADIFKDYLEEIPFRLNEMTFILEQSPSFLGETRDMGLILGSIEKLLFEEKQRGLGTSLSSSLLAQTGLLLKSIVLTTLSYHYGPQYRTGPNSLLGYFKGLSIWLPQSSQLYNARREEMSEALIFAESRWVDLFEYAYNAPSPGLFNLAF